MTDKIHLEIAALRDHVTELHNIAASGKEAVDAAKYIQVHGDAFGILCSFIGAALEPFTLAGMGATAASMGMVDGLAAAVGKATDLMESTDSEVSAFWQKVMS